MPGDLVLARMDNSTAVAYAKYGAGMSPATLKNWRYPFDAPWRLRVLPAGAIQWPTLYPASRLGRKVGPRLRTASCGESSAEAWAPIVVVWMWI